MQGYNLRYDSLGEIFHAQSISIHPLITDFHQHPLSVELNSTLMDFLPILSLYSTFYFSRAHQHAPLTLRVASSYSLVQFLDIQSDFMRHCSLFDMFLEFSTAGHIMFSSINSHSSTSSRTWSSTATFPAQNIFIQLG